MNVAALTDGNGLAEAILAVQGPGGLSREVRRFDIVSRDPLQFQQDAPLTGFPGPWFITTSRDFPYLPGEGEGESASFGMDAGSDSAEQDRLRDAWTAEGEGAEPWWPGLFDEEAVRDAPNRDSEDDQLFSDLTWLEQLDTRALLAS